MLTVIFVLSNLFGDTWRRLTNGGLSDIKKTCRAIATKGRFRWRFSRGRQPQWPRRDLMAFRPSSDFPGRLRQDARRQEWRATGQPFASTSWGVFLVMEIAWCVPDEQEACRLPLVAPIMFMFERRGTPPHLFRRHDSGRLHAGDERRITPRWHICDRFPQGTRGGRRTRSTLPFSS